VIADAHLGVGRDRAREVRIDQEVLSKGLRRTDRVTSRQVPDGGGAQTGRGDRRATS
jgi:hypothetical protein